MMQLKHWQDAVNAILGVWLILSPWAMGFQGETMAVSNAVIVGLALIAAALGAIFVPRAWEEWTEGALGVWLVVSPWVLGFASAQCRRGGHSRRGAERLDARDRQGIRRRVEQAHCRVTG